MKLKQTSKSRCGSALVRFTGGVAIAALLITVPACHVKARRATGTATDISTVASASDCGECASSDQASVPVAQTDAGQAATQTVPSQPRVLRVALFIDQTGSMEQARVQRVSAEAIAPLLDRLQTSGGELGVGLIRERSDAPLARVFVPPPPAAPILRPRHASNIFEKAKEQRRQDEERARYTTRQKAWSADATARINAFQESIAPLFENTDAPATDIHAALLRADIFVSEPNAFAQSAENVVILVTDGVETVDPQTPAHFSAPAELLLVNGTGSEGQLEALHPIRFEALDAAIRYVLDGGAHVRR